jgi:hypothetical protein
MAFPNCFEDMKEALHMGLPTGLPYIDVPTAGFLRTVMKGSKVVNLIGAELGYEISNSSGVIDPGMFNPIDPTGPHAFTRNPNENIASIR